MVKITTHTPIKTKTLPPFLKLGGEARAKGAVYRGYTPRNIAYAQSRNTSQITVFPLDFDTSDYDLRRGLFNG
jgi:hypothetical protein